ncbi:hypothetical protein P7K49_002984 [Saguinus oedipus]|uniref:Uncharacterized protein n=1 Tax=Saguinus oedipus TaxID=9490 RepID=A0ABQ9WLJ2_SAGOE|nr:hypothetical protein P7K49_002984 [Saguinus oedipus]
MELSAIGEQVFAVESIRKKRVRKDPGGVPPVPSTAPSTLGLRGKAGRGAPAALRCWAVLPSPCLSFPATV